MLKLVMREPVAMVALIEAVLALVVAFGFNLSTEQLGVIVAVVTAALALVARSQVSPTNGST
jgi:uncharacterized membrane protein